MAEDLHDGGEEEAHGDSGEVEEAHGVLQIDRFPCNRGLLHSGGVADLALREAAQSLFRHTDRGLPWERHVKMLQCEKILHIMM